MTWYDGSPVPDPRHDPPAGGPPRDPLPDAGAACDVLPVAGSPEVRLPAIGAPWDEVGRGTAPRDEPGRDEAALAAVGAGRARLRTAAQAASVAVDARDRQGGSPGPGGGGRRAPGPGPASPRVAPGPGYDDGRGAPGRTDAGGSAGSGHADDGDVASRGLGHDDAERAGPGPGFDAEPERAERLRLADVVRWRLAPRTAVIALGALLLVGGAVAVRSAAQPTGDPVAVEEPAVTRGAAPDTEGASTDGAEAAAVDPTVWVHVVGRVASPGVVALPEGSRVGDAVAAAGGALPDADLAGLNLAAVVQDGAQIRVPAPGEEPPAAADDGAGGGGGSGGGGGAVDVNTAGSAELQTLPGIGPVLADRIVAWRDANGPFPDVDALLDVSGIGPAVLGQIRDLVRV
jgi:competence protein ComEA